MWMEGNERSMHTERLEKEEFYEKIMMMYRCYCWVLSNREDAEGLDLLDMEGKFLMYF